MSQANLGLSGQLDALSEAVDIANGRLDEEQVAFGRHVIAKATERLRHGTTHTLVALLGATGSGKSSVANAIVESNVATAGLRRPTTSSTLACYWEGTGASDDEVQGLLDWLEVKNRHEVVSPGWQEDKLAGLVLLDVPDHDSVAVAHRLEMERIAEHADLLLWVTDAEKYADKAMHDYLRQLGEHGAVTAMVLNKSDLLSELELGACVADLSRLLDEDGLPTAPVLAVSTATGDGIDVLAGVLADTVSAKRATVDRLAADTRTAAIGLLGELGDSETGRRAQKKREKHLTQVGDELARELVGASGLETVCDAVMAGHERDASARVGWPFTRWVRQLRPHPLRRLHLGHGSAGKPSLPKPSGVQLARSESAVRTATAAVAGDMADPWPELIAEAGTPNQRDLNNRIEAAISTSVRNTGLKRDPRWWAAVNTLQILLALAAVAGAIWLGLLALNGYLQLPRVPTPNIYKTPIPVPTGLLVGGLAIGALLAAIAKRLAVGGGRRRAAQVREDAEITVVAISNEMVMAPMRAELANHDRLRDLLDEAASGRTT